MTLVKASTVTRLKLDYGSMVLEKVYDNTSCTAMMNRQSAARHVLESHVQHPKLLPISGKWAEDHSDSSSPRRRELQVLCF
jgi:hypothetical protein